MIACPKVFGTHRMYWFLTLRADLAGELGNIGVVKGRKIGAAPWVEMGLRQLLIAAGIDAERDGVSIVPVPNTGGASVNFGLMAAKALQEGLIDGFWANGMGTEVAVRSGAGKVVLDVRRGDGPKECLPPISPLRAARVTMTIPAARRMKPPSWLWASQSTRWVLSVRSDTQAAPMRRPAPRVRPNQTPR
jgi:hypothetical protein